MQFSSVPAWSFGLKGKGNTAGGDIPGPGEYKQKDPGWRGGRQFAKSPRSRQKEISEVGPGKYNTNTTSFKKNGAIIQGKAKEFGGYSFII